MNNRLPLENSPYALETWSKLISNDSQHLIFQCRKFCLGICFWNFSVLEIRWTSFLSGFWGFWWKRMSGRASWRFFDLDTPFLRSVLPNIRTYDLNDVNDSIRTIRFDPSIDRFDRFDSIDSTRSIRFDRFDSKDAIRTIRESNDSRIEGESYDNRTF